MTTHIAGDAPAPALITRPFNLTNPFIIILHKLMCSTEHVACVGMCVANSILMKNSQHSTQIEEILWQPIDMERKAFKPHGWTKFN